MSIKQGEVVSLEKLTSLDVINRDLESGRASVFVSKEGREHPVDITSIKRPLETDQTPSWVEMKGIHRLTKEEVRIFFDLEEESGSMRFL